MRSWLLLALLCAAPWAGADSSVGSAAPEPPTRCNYEEAPYWKARRDLDGFRRGAFDHGHLVHATPRHLVLSHIRGEGHPARTLVVEDSVHGIAGARAAGMRVVGFTGASHTYPSHADRLTEAGAETVISRMSELPGVIAALAEWQEAI